MPTPTPIPPVYPNLWGIDWPTSISIVLALTAVLLAAITILLVLCGIFGFMSIRRTAKQRAEETAREVSGKVAEDTTNRYIQEHMAEIVAAYGNMMSGVDAASRAEANLIAEEEIES